MNIAAAYIRVSTDKQDELSPDAQVRLLKDYAASHDLLLPEEYIYREIGISGRKADRRPQFQEMIAAAKTKPTSPFQVILVWKFSRFARNQEESIVYKSLLKKQCNVDVASVSEPLIDGPFGTLIERIIEWMDEYYSIRLSGEVTRGMTERAIRGGHQSYAPFGYKMVNRELVPDPDTADVVRNIYKQFLAGVSFQELARYVTDQGYRTKFGNAFERRNIEYILRNPVYIGKVLWSKNGKRRRHWDLTEDVIVAQGSHQPLITQEEYDQVQKIIDLQKILHSPKSRPTNEYAHWLSGLMKCSACGGSMTVATANGKRATSWQCRNYSGGRCRTSHSISTRKLEAAIIEQLHHDVAGADAVFVHYIPPKGTNDELERAKLALSRIPQKLQRIKAAFTAGIDTIEEYAINKRALLQEEEDLNKKIQELQEQANQDTNVINFPIRIQHALDVLESDASISDKRDAIRSIIEKIIYHKEEQSLEIVYYTN